MRDEGGYADEVRFRWFTFWAFFVTGANTLKDFGPIAEVRLMGVRSIDFLISHFHFAPSAIFPPLPCSGEDEGEGARIP
jgi:hypothetical protein